MEHHLAIDEQLPEKYVFGELSEAERDDFEEHLADCTRCMEDVRMAEAFAANSYAVFHEEGQNSAAGMAPAKESRVTWWKMHWALAFSGGLNLALASAALYAFIAVIPFLKSEIRNLESPAVSASFVLGGVSRSARPLYTVPRNSSASFRLDLPQLFDNYVCVIEDPTDRRQKTYNLRMTENGETLDLTIPVAGLDPGDYRVTLRGLRGNQSQLLDSFVLRVKPAQ